MNFKDGTIWGTCVQKIHKELSNHFGESPSEIDITQVINRLEKYRQNLLLVNKLVFNTEYWEFHVVLLEHLNFIDNQNALAFPINKELACRQFLKVLLESKTDHEEGLNKPF